MSYYDSDVPPVPSRVQDTLGCSPQSGRIERISKPPESHQLDECILDETELRQHLSDLETVGDELVATLKDSPQASARTIEPMDMIAPLVKSDAFGAQVEYSRGGRRWLDTLIATQHGVRLVRLQLSA